MQKQNSFPKISVITPVKNAVNTIEKAIKSLIEQNYPNLEYIIIDGDSTDGTLDIIKKYEKYINYWQSTNDENNVTAYIAGIAKASGEIINFLNADDFYEPEILLKIGEIFKNEPDLDIVSSNYRVVTNDSKTQNYKIIYESNRDDMVLDKNKIIQSMAPNARFFKKTLFTKYGLPIEKDNQNRVFISNDLEYLIRFTLRGVKNKIIDCIGYNYLSHSTSLTFTNGLETKKRLYEDKIFVAKKFLTEPESLLPEIWKKTFKKWIIKYRTKIISIDLKQRNWRKVKSNLILGIKENRMAKFLFYLLKTLIRNQD
jgi:glycosyltransferase involved in cell wall biosynthesis